MAKLLLSVAETAELLGVSNDLIYELTMRSDLPCIQFGRRKLIPRQATESIIESIMDGFNTRRSIGALGIGSPQTKPPSITTSLRDHRPTRSGIGRASASKGEPCSP